MFLEHTDCLAASLVSSLCRRLQELPSCQPSIPMPFKCFFALCKLLTRCVSACRHCKWCGKFKPDRCHHCRVCRSLVEGIRPLVACVRKDRLGKWTGAAFQLAHPTFAHALQFLRKFSYVCLLGGRTDGCAGLCCVRSLTLVLVVFVWHVALVACVFAFFVLYSVSFIVFTLLFLSSFLSFPFLPFPFVPFPFLSFPLPFLPCLLPFILTGYWLMFFLSPSSVLTFFLSFSFRVSLSLRPSFPWAT